MTTDVLVNSIYPVSYFTLPGVDQIQYPDTFWWSSTSRYAAVDLQGVNYQAVTDGGLRTSEYIEIDLGRIREVNFLNFDVLRAPIDIQIEYDGISTPERAASWQPVARTSELPFDNYVTFDANNRTAWQNVEFNFGDSKGNMIHTRYLRLTFTRRDEAWPTSTSAPFAWPVFVKHLRMGRYIATLRDTVGPLLTQDTPSELTETTLYSIDSITSQEVRQRFVYPANSVRADQTPAMLGFGVLVSTTSLVDYPNTPDVSLQWSLWDVTDNDAPVKLRSGVETGSVNDGLSWMDFYLDDKLAVEGDLTKTYELRVSSNNVASFDKVYTHTPNQLSSKAVPGTLDFTHGSLLVSTSVDTTASVFVGDHIVRADLPDQVFQIVAIDASQITLSDFYSGTDSTGSTGAIVYPSSQYDAGVGDYVFDASRNLVMRVWADVADEGRDVLGNSYRYVTRKEKAKYVHDNTRAGWMSEPVPTPDAVESLYFDVRGTDPEGFRTATLIEAISIAPRTPGVRMNVYWTQQNIQGERPQILNDWDYMLWTPVQETYTLRRNEILELPQPIKCAFIKLEFTALNPLPFNIPDFPPLPPRLYRRYPTWVEDQFNNSTIRNTVEDWFLRNATPVQTKVLASLRDPVNEFEYMQREFLAALALGTVQADQLVSAGIVDIKDKALIDPVTASRVYIQGTDQFQSSLLVSVDQESILGKLVVERFDPNVLSDPIELPNNVAFNAIGNVSTINDRVTESYQSLAQIPMRFNRTARHVYTYEQAEFNKKAYFVGIDEVRFLRNNYTVVRDEALIVDILHDDEMLEENTFERADLTSIPDNTLLYVSYSVNPDVVDEPVFFSGHTPIALAQTGYPARNVVVYSAQNKQGVQYFQTDDYDLSFGYDDNGVLINYISRSRLAERMTVPLQDVIYADAATVIGRGFIPSPPTYDAGVVTGSGSTFTLYEGPFMPDYGAGLYGGGFYKDMTTLQDDANTAVGTGVVSGVESPFAGDSATVIGVGVVSFVEVGGPTADVGTVIGVGIPTGDLVFEPIDAATPRGIGRPSATEDRLRDDAGTSTGVGVPSYADAPIFGDSATPTGVSAPSAADIAIFIDADTGLAVGAPITTQEDKIP